MKIRGKRPSKDEKIELQMTPMIDILKLMKDSKSPMQELLKAICEKCPKNIPLHYNYIEVSSSSHGTSLKLSPLCFLILESVEVQFDSALYQIDAIGPMSYVLGQL